MIKKYLLCSLVAASIFNFSTQIVSAQNQILANKTKTSFTQQKANAYNLFTISNSKDASVENAIVDVTYLKLNKQSLKSLNADKAATLIFTLPLKGKMVDVKLERRDIYTDDFQAWVLQADNSYKVDPNYQKGNFYRGYIDGHEVSLAAFSFYENEMGAIFSIAGHGNYNLVLNTQNPGIDNDNYLLFNESDILNSDKYRAACQTGDDQTVHTNTQTPKQKTTAGGSCKYVTIALYGDHMLYQNRNSSLTNTQNYLTTMFNGNATLFENDEMKIVLKNLYVNQSPDNYPSSSSSAVLNRFGNDIGVNTTADLMQMVTGHLNNQGWSSLGGLAYLDVLCLSPYYSSQRSTYIGPFSMTNNSGLDPIPNVPIYSWDVSASTHEMGHNMGSPHTHACAWNNNNTNIDGCAPTFNLAYREGNCNIGPVPNNGTIMSYCHLLQNVGVDFNNGFGAQPKALLIDKINSSGCLASVSPNTILNSASQTITANNYCIDNNWVYFYYDNNDNNTNNDMLVLAVNNSAIGTMNLSNVVVSTTTTNAFSTNIANLANYNYASYHDWHEFNRTWSFNAPNALTGNSKIRFPFNTTDFNDMKGSLPVLNNLNELYAVIHTTNAANINPPASDSNQTKKFAYATNGTASTWVLNNSNPGFNLAEITVNGSFYGGTLGFGTKKKPTSIDAFLNTFNLNIYPNPADQALNIDLNNIALQNATVTVIDNLGRAIYNQKLQANTHLHTIDISKLAAGFYAVKILNKDGIYVAKFIKK